MKDFFDSTTTKRYTFKPDRRRSILLPTLYNYYKFHNADKYKFRIYTVKHQMFGLELNRWFAKTSEFLLVRQCIFLIGYTQTNLKIRYLSVTNILWSGSMCAPLLRTLMFYSNNNLTLMILQKKMPEFYDPGILWSEHNRYFIVNSSLFEYKNADLLKLLKIIKITCFDPL